jgi:hypothetical protein
MGPAPGRIVGDDAVPTAWYRNTGWSPSIERDFQARLGRAREGSKGQYLLIQAQTLEQTHATVALDLLSQYFALQIDRPDPQAHVARAVALTSLGRLEDAIASYEAALACEREFSNLRTQAYLELPGLITKHQLRTHYGRAAKVLRDHEHRPSFPIEHFRWNAFQALISAECGARLDARTYAKRALEVVGERHSGFRHHPSVGLVGEESADLIRQLHMLAAD